MKDCKGALTGNTLKLIAAVAMLLDHAGILLFPRVMLFRILGRLAYPIYAFMVAEGCRYTHNKPRYFLQMFGLGAACQIVYYLFSGDTYLNILLTFSLSIGLIYLLQVTQGAEGIERWIYAAAFLLAVTGVWALNQYLTIDYGFWGIMTPVLCGLFPEKAKTGSKLPVLMMAVGLLALGYALGGVQWYALLSLPLLLLYSGRRGKLKMKHFFYIFYPTHLAVLQGIAILLQ